MIHIMTDVESNRLQKAQNPLQDCIGTYSGIELKASDRLNFKKGWRVLPRVEGT
jgi:hypothetical protein